MRAFKCQGIFQKLVIDGVDPVNAFLLDHKYPQYAACSRARGIVNRLPLEQRSKHYSRITARQNQLRADIKRLENR